MSQPAGSRGSPRGKEGFPRREHSSLWLREYKRGCAPFFDNLIEGNFRLVYSIESSPKGSVEDPLLGGTKNSVKNDYLERILRARVYDVAVETPLEVAPNLSARLGNRVLLKREDMQPVFSFKCRGAYNKMANLPARALARGVIASSAGNHAQGVALAAQKLGCGAAIVMPTTTPKIKVDAVKARGAEVHLRGDTYDEAYAEARRLARSRKLAFVHPYDDPDVIAGQGTIGMEILRQATQPLDAVFVAVGGGGLISGIASYIKRLRPSVKVIGVEPVDADAMARSLKAGRRVVFEDTRTILEPAGALAIAGAKIHVERTGVRGKRLVAVASGANTNFDRLRFVAERAEVGEHREAILAVTIPERPGSFKKFCATLGARNITEFNYRIADPKEAHVFVGVEVHNRDETARIVKVLEREGLKALDLSEDEMAKLHVRHMVGGHAPAGIRTSARGAPDELLYRFEFPERPGALMNFLSNMRTDWNISLFHYRNQGSDYGRVLVGMQVPRGEMREFRRFLEALGYPCVEETRNPAYRLFLG